MKIISGQSLFEVVVALAVVTLIIIALVALASTSIRNVDFSKNKTLATRYSQEAIEWLRGERDFDFDAFYQKALTPTWCMDTLVLDDIGQCDTTEVIAGTIFRREAAFSIINSANVEAEVNVYWEDAQGLHEVKTVTNFTDWRTQ